MLISFSVSNFRSFATEETLSMVASKRPAGSHESHTLPLPATDESVLKAAVVYGANGAGKSNLIKALEFLKETALESRARGNRTGRVPFRLSNLEAEPTGLDIQFAAAGKTYRYGCKLTDQQITEEWLYGIKGRQTPIFERVTRPDNNVEVTLGRNFERLTKLKALATVGSPENQSFLATINSNLKPDDRGPDLRSVIDWFSQVLIIIGPQSKYGPLLQELEQDSEFKAFAEGFLKHTSTGVDRLEVTRTALPDDELNKRLSPDMISQVRQKARETNRTIVLSGLHHNIVVEPGQESSFAQVEVNAVHTCAEERTVMMPLEEESDGTKRLLNLIPALHSAQRSPHVFVIDEIDRSLHPMLVREFMNFFLNHRTEANSQFVVTTHESTLLDQDLLRRDEVWFAEKDTTGATRLYSLLEFKVRKDLEIRKNYLQGRFGAIPYLAGLNSLLSEPPSHS